MVCVNAQDTVAETRPSDGKKRTANVTCHLTNETGPRLLASYRTTSKVRTTNRACVLGLSSWEHVILKAGEDKETALRRCLIGDVCGRGQPSRRSPSRGLLSFPFSSRAASSCLPFNTSYARENHRNHVSYSWRRLIEIIFFDLLFKALPSSLRPHFCQFLYPRRLRLGGATGCHDGL